MWNLWLRCATLGGLLLAAFALPAAAQSTTATWVGPAAGDWDDPLNWSSGVVPDSSDVDVVIDGLAGQDTTVTVPVSTFFQANRLAVAEGNALELDLNAEVLADGDLVLAGRLTLRQARASFGGLADIASTALVDLDGGELSLGPAFRSSSFFTNEGQVRGAGLVLINGVLENRSSIVADTDQAELRLSIGNTQLLEAIENLGVLEATGGGALRIGGTPFPVAVRNLAGGGIVAGAGSRVLLDDVRLTGGSLTAAPATADASAGEVSILRGLLRGVVLDGEIVFERTGFAGTIDNRGALRHTGIDPDRVNILGDTRLIGGGELRISDPLRSFRPIVALGFDSPSSRLTNEDNTIRGAADFNLGVVNRGLIEAGYGPETTAATSEPRIVFASDEPLVNAGTLRAPAETAIEFFTRRVENREGGVGGVIEVATGGRALFSSVEVVGGTLRSGVATVEELGDEQGAGAIVFNRIGGGGNSRLVDVTIEGVVGSDESRVAVEGNLHNTGVLRTRDLQFNQNVNLTGGGVLIVGELGGEIVTPDRFDERQPILTNFDNEVRLHDVRLSGRSFDPAPLLINHGTVTAAGSSQLLDRVTILNSSVVRAEAGAFLELGAIEATSPEAELHVEAGGSVQVGRVIGGVLRADAAADGELAASAEVFRLQDTRVEGVVRFNLFNGELAGGIVNNGVLEAFRDLRVGTPSLRLTGDGVLRLANTLFNFEPQNGQLGGSVVRNGPAHTIAGSGEIRLFDRGFFNEGGIAAENGVLTIDVDQGLFVQRGVLSTTANSELRVTDNSFEPVLRNEGRIEAVGGVFDYADELINESGATLLAEDGGRINAGSIDNLEGGRLGGDGLFVAGDFFTPLLRNAGTVAPGAADGSFGHLAVLSDFEQTATGVLEIEVGGFNSGEGAGGDGEPSHDVLIVDEVRFGVGGSATLGGEVRFVFDEGLTPQLGDEVAFLFVNPRTVFDGLIFGEFDTVTGLPELDPGLDWELVYSRESVAAVVTSSDANQDGVVTAADYVLIRDGAANASLDTWRRRFGETISPDTTAAAAVPEPSAGLLLLVGVGFANRRRR